MPNVKFFVYSLGTEVNSSNPQMGPVVVAPQVNYALQYIPSLFSFGIACGINGIISDEKSNYTTGVSFLGPDGEEIAKVLDVPLVVPLNSAIEVPCDEIGFVLALNFQNVSIQKAGVHKTIVYIDGEAVGEYPIYIGRRIDEK